MASSSLAIAGFRSCVYGCFIYNQLGYYSLNLISYRKQCYCFIIPVILLITAVLFVLEAIAEIRLINKRIR